jgi:hypothetical protein
MAAPEGVNASLTALFAGSVIPGLAAIESARVVRIDAVGVFGNFERFFTDDL